MSETEGGVEIPIDQVDIAPENMRFEEPPTEDDTLAKNIREVGLLQDLVGYWGENGRFKVVIGRDRLHALKATGVKTIKPKVRPELRGYEGTKASLSENVVRSDVDPVTRARAVKRLVEMNPKGLAGVARDTRIPKASLSEWTRILELDEVLLDHIKRGTIPYTNALHLAKASLSPVKQATIAIQLEQRGPGVLRELMREEGVETRGAPKGLLTLRFNFNPQDTQEQRYYKMVQDEASRRAVDPGMIIKDLVIEWAKGKLKEELKERKKAKEQS